MVARLRLWESFKEKLLFVAIALIITVGFPLIAEIAGRDPSDIPGLIKLDQIGSIVLRAAPIILLLLFLYNFWAIKRRQKQINQKIMEEGVTYLILPRADGSPVQASNVTLWHRVAMPYYKHISFEMTGGEDEIVFSLRTCEDTEARNILSKVMAEWPGTLMRRSGDPIPEEAYYIEIKPQTKDQPIVASTPDPLGALLTEISVLPKGIKAGIQVMVREDPFTRLNHLRRADKKTRRNPSGQDMPFIINSQPNKQYQYRPSAEERREIRWLDLRAQEAFLEARLVIWAYCDDEKIARQTAIRLAETVTAQYHPNNKLIKGWRCKKGNVRARTYPTFAGRPWIASELGTIAHLVGKDALFAAPQLAVAPARPLPASPACRLPQDLEAAIYLLDQDQVPLLVTDDLPQVYLEKFESLPPVLSEELPALRQDSERPTI